MAATPERGAGLSGGAAAYLVARLEPTDEEMIRLDWADMTAEGIVAGFPSGMTVTVTPQIVFQAVTPFGQRLIRFLEVVVDE